MIKCIILVTKFQKPPSPVTFDTDELKLRDLAKLWFFICLVILFLFVLFIIFHVRQKLKLKSTFVFAFLSRVVMS